MEKTQEELDLEREKELEREIQLEKEIAALKGRTEKNLDFGKKLTKDWPMAAARAAMKLIDAPTGLVTHTVPQTLWDLKKTGKPTAATNWATSLDPSEGYGSFAERHGVPEGASLSDSFPNAFEEPGEGKWYKPEKGGMMDWNVRGTLGTLADVLAPAALVSRSAQKLMGKYLPKSVAAKYGGAAEETLGRIEARSKPESMGGRGNIRRPFFDDVVPDYANLGTSLAFNPLRTGMKYLGSREYQKALRPLDLEMVKKGKERMSPKLMDKNVLGGWAQVSQRLDLMEDELGKKAKETLKNADATDNLWVQRGTRDHWREVPGKDFDPVPDAITKGAPDRSTYSGNLELPGPPEVLDPEDMGSFAGPKKPKTFEKVGETPWAVQQGGVNLDAAHSNARDFLESLYMTNAKGERMVRPDVKELHDFLQGRINSLGKFGNVSREHAQDLNTDIYNILGEKAWTDGSRKVAPQARKALTAGYRREIRKHPDSKVTTQISKDMGDWGSSITAKKEATKQSNKEFLKDDLFKAGDMNRLALMSGLGATLGGGASGNYEGALLGAGLPWAFRTYNRPAVRGSFGFGLQKLADLPVVGGLVPNAADAYARRWLVDSMKEEEPY